MGSLRRYYSAGFLAIFVQAIFLISTALATDVPHFSANNVGCYSCHQLHGGYGNDILLPEWVGSYTPLNDEDKPRNILCWHCHNGGVAQSVKTHSYLRTSDKYGKFVVECWVCHDTHTQEQFIYRGTTTYVNDYEIEEAGDPWAGRVDEFVGMKMYLDPENLDVSYTITGNTADAVQVDGPIDDPGVPHGNVNINFAIGRDKLVRGNIDLANIKYYDGTPPKSGIKQPRLLRQTGCDSYADCDFNGDGIFTGICEVCHTETKYHKNDGSGDPHGHGPAQSNCIKKCHTHENGFMHGSGSGGCVECHGHDSGSNYDPDMNGSNGLSLTGANHPGSGSYWSHSTHTESNEKFAAAYEDDKMGPAVYCDTCHDITDMPLFKDGQDFANTTVCDNCHSREGTYDGVDNPVYGAKANWDNDPAVDAGTGIYKSDRTLKSGKEKWCAGCHDEKPGNSRPDGFSGVDAPNVVGDEEGAFTYDAFGIGWGYYKTGHGLPATQTYPASGGLSQGAGAGCGDCHDLGSAHIDHDKRTFNDQEKTSGVVPSLYRMGYRLKLIGGEEPMAVPKYGGTDSSQYRLCANCHTNAAQFTDSSEDAPTNFVGSNTRGVNEKNYHQYHLAVSGLRFKADWGSGGDYASDTWTSRINCITCHNVHGSTNLAMMRDGKLIDREDGVRLWYYNSNMSPNITPPQPEDLVLPASEGLIWKPASSGKVCWSCHGGSGNELFWRPGDPYNDQELEPTLAWTAENGYSADGVNPDTGVPPDTEFVFRVKYTDLNNDAPSEIILWIDANNNGVYTDAVDSSYSLINDGVNGTDDNYFNGKIYSKTLILDNTNGNTLRYKFTAKDDSSGALDATGDPTTDHILTFVAANNPPVLEWVSGACRDKGVSPAAEVSGASFTFYVKYTDIDNDAPAPMEVWIDLNDDGDFEDADEKQTMSVDSGDLNYINGENYTYSRILSYAGDGKLNYRFVATDGTDSATGEPTSDNTVTVISTSGTVYTVCSSGCDYTTIQDGVNAGSGQTVLVYQGTYHEQVQFNGAGSNNIHVRSVCGREYTIIDAASMCQNPADLSWAPCYTTIWHLNGSTGSIIEGFQLTNSDPTMFPDTRGVYSVGGSLTIEDCRIDNHPSGGVESVYNFESGGIVFRNSEIDSNTRNNGAGLYLKKGADHALINTVVRNNIATGNGGAVFMDTSNLSVVNSNIVDNQAVHGGGFVVDGTLDVVNSVVASNTASGNGGGFTANTWVLINVRNSILWNNKAQVDPNSDHVGGHVAFRTSTTTMNIYDSIVDHNHGEVFGEWPYFVKADNNSSPLNFYGFISGDDPMFIDQDNPTIRSRDYHIRDNSPAIDNGSAANAPDEDIDLDVRPQWSGYDIGSDEIPAPAGANSVPILKWTEGAGYESDGVEPDSGACGSTFVFKVSYMDANDDPPGSVELWIDKNDDGDFDDTGEKLPMVEESSGDIVYTDGKIYYLDNVVLEAGFDGQISYRFFATDGTDDAFGSPTNESSVSISLPNVSITSVTPVALGELGETATVQLDLSASSACDISVPFSYSGTAQGFGVDYTVSENPIIFAAGDTTKTFTITSVDDLLDEEDTETVELYMGSPVNATRGIPSYQSITISDNDSPPSVFFDLASSAASEGIGTANISVTLDAVSGRDVSIPLTIGGTAAQGVDYTMPGSIIIPAGYSNLNLPVMIVPDTLDENDETVDIDMDAPTNAILGAQDTHALTITDDDDPPLVNFTVGSQDTAAEKGMFPITVELSAASSFDVTVPFAIGGTADDPTDYTITASPVVIPAGETSIDIEAIVQVDYDIEPDETVIVTLSDSITNGTKGSTFVHTLNILNDDVLVAGQVILCLDSGCSPCADACRLSDHTTIQDAINNAGATGYTVLAKDGVYRENIDFSGKDITVISQNGPATTIIHGADSLPNLPVVTFSTGETASAVLDGFTIDNHAAYDGNISATRGVSITNSSAPTLKNSIITGNQIVWSSSGGGISGAGIFINIGSATIEDTIVGGDPDNRNTCDGSGCGIYATSLTAPLTITGSTISESRGAFSGGGVSLLNNGAQAITFTDSTISNNACWQPGGGIFVSDSIILISGSTLSGNSNSNGGTHGGALHITGTGSKATIDTTNFTGNSIGAFGGGIYMTGSTVNPPLSITSSTFTNNLSGQSGGAIYVDGLANESVFSDITVNNNIANRSGGGICAANSKISLTDSVFNGNSNTWGGSDGGALFITGAAASATVTNTTFHENSVNGAGGAISVENSTQTTPLTLTNSTFTENTGVSGGAIYVGGMTNESILDNITVSENTSYGSGGGIYVSGAKVSLTDATLSGNNTVWGTSSGGAMFITGADSTVTVTNTDFIENFSMEDGGAVNISGSTHANPLTMTNCTISDNGAERRGGGINFDSLSNEAVLSKVTISGNKAINNDGAGIYLTASGKAKLTNCIIAGNAHRYHTSLEGGGIYNAGTLNIFNSTVAGNYSPTGGGLFTTGTTNIKNSIFWDNVAGIADNEISGTAAVIYSDVEGGYVGSGTFDGDASGTGNIGDDLVNHDPRFVWSDPASVDTPETSGIYLIRDDSNVIDQGKATGTEIPSDDIESHTRPQAGGIDMGADEFYIHPNGTLAGTATAVAVDDTSIYVEMPFTGDANDDNTFTVNYKLSSSTVWTLWGTSTSTPSPYATTITGLTPNEVYDVQLIYTDPDGVANQAEQIITGIDLTLFVDLTSPSQAVAETVGTVTITATLTLPNNSSDVTVPFTVSGTAEGGGKDHDLADGSIVITSGLLTGTIDFTVTNDLLDDYDEETVIVTMGVPVNASAGPIGVHTVTISDDDPTPSVSFTSALQSVAESIGSATITAQLSAASSFDVTVPFTIDGGSTATQGASDDYTVTGASVIIPAGSTSADITITVNNDSLDENDETVIVNMGTPTNATQGATTQHTATITDDDPTPTVNFTNASQSVAEDAGSTTITVQLSAASSFDVTVPFTIDGGSTATQGATDDYTITGPSVIIPAGSISADITITVNNDSLDENNETVIVNMDSPTNATQGTTTQHTATITDDDPIPSVTFTSASLSIDEDGGLVTITAQLSAVSGRNVTVPFTLSGDAVEGASDDYTITATPLTIPIGSTSEDITVTINDDSSTESDEMVIVTMSAPTNATQGATTVHTITILANDAPANLTVGCGGGPPNYGTISGAITAASSGDIIEVCDGIYSEKINYGSKKLNIRSLNGAAVTTIQGDGSNAAVVTFGNSALDSTTVLDGFTIDNQAAVNSSTRGISITSSAAPTLKNLVVKGNKLNGGGDGAGIYISGATATIKNSIISDATGTTTCDKGCGIYAAYLTDELTIRNTTITGNTSSRDGAGIMLELNYSVPTSIIDSTFSDNTAVDYGGAVNANNSKITISGSTFSNNKVTTGGRYGGAINYYNSGSDSQSLTITGTDFDTNTATSQGGAICVSTSANTTPVSITGGSFTNNYSAQYGGAVYFLGGTTDATVTGPSFTGNSVANNGGAIYVNSADLDMMNTAINGNTTVLTGGGLYASGGTVTVTGGTINSNDGQNGGGIEGNNGATITVTGTEINGNTADYNGGGIRILGGSTLTMDKVTLQGNEVTQAGAGVNCTSSTLNITNSVVTGNASTNDWQSGGGIWTSSCTTTITSSTVSCNQAGRGGGLYCGGTCAVKGSIFWGNTARNSGTHDLENGTINVEYTDIGIGSYTPDSPNTNVSTDPLFQANCTYTVKTPTTTGNYHIQSGSPCRDAGPVYVDVDDYPNDDIDGFGRPLPSGATNIDMGADERE